MKHRASKLRHRYGRAAGATKRFVVTRIRLNSGGYDSGGRYYGGGAPLFSVEDVETGREETVRASSAKVAREKIMEGVFGPPPKNPFQGEARVLSKAIAAEPYGKSKPAVARQYKAQLEALSARVRRANPDDRAWGFYDKDMAALDEESSYAFGKLHSAAQMIEGAAERIR